MPALPQSQRRPGGRACSEDYAPAGLAAYISAAPLSSILLGSCYLLYRAARIRMKRRAQTDDRGCNDDECHCEDDKAGWIGAKEERYRDDPVDAEAHRLRAAHLAKQAYLDRDMNHHQFHNTAMPNTTLDNTTPPPDWPSKSHDPSTGVPLVTPPPPPPPTSAPAVIDGRAYTWQEEQFSNADMAVSAAAAGIYPSTATIPTTFAVGAPATPATEPRRRPYTKSAAGIEVIGEVVTGEGWRRHTRVYGGGYAWRAWG